MFNSNYMYKYTVHRLFQLYNILISHHCANVMSVRHQSPLQSTETYATITDFVASSKLKYVPPLSFAPTLPWCIAALGTRMIRLGSRRIHRGGGLPSI